MCLQLFFPRFGAPRDGGCSFGGPRLGAFFLRSLATGGRVARKTWHGTWQVGRGPRGAGIAGVRHVLVQLPFVRN